MLLEYEAIRLPAGLSCLFSANIPRCSLSDPLGITIPCGEGTVLPPRENILTTALFVRIGTADSGKSRSRKFLGVLGPGFLYLTE